MLKNLIVTNYLGDKVTIALKDGEPSHGMIIKDMTGLGPPKGILNMADYATDDGSKWNSSRADKRTIQMTFILTMIPDIESARENTYKYFPLKKEVNLVFETDHRLCEINGRVESNEPSIFTEQATETITIVCEDPWFYKIGEGDPQITNFSAVDPLFEFPFSNESLDEKLIEFGEYTVHKEQNIYYEGDVTAGMTITIQALAGGVGDITIYNFTTRETMIIHTDKIQTITGKAFTTGDQIVISTVDRTRKAQLLRAGTYTNILNAVDRSSQWFQLEKGDNIMAYATSEDHDDYITFVVENRIMYEGI